MRPHFEYIDNKVSLKKKESIAALALQWRELAGINDHDQIDVVSSVGRLCRTKMPDKGIQKLDLYCGEAGYLRCYVTFRPTCIHIEQETWDFAKYRDPDSIYVLAHEVGLVVMHDHHAKAFTSEGAKFDMHGLDE